MIFLALGTRLIIELGEAKVNLEVLIIQWRLIREIQNIFVADPLSISIVDVPELTL
jgi:hypothetical protein